MPAKKSASSEKWELGNLARFLGASDIPGWGSANDGSSGYRRCAGSTAGAQRRPSRHQPVWPSVTNLGSGVGSVRPRVGVRGCSGRVRVRGSPWFCRRRRRGRGRMVRRGGWVYRSGHSRRCLARLDGSIVYGAFGVLGRSRVGWSSGCRCGSPCTDSRVQVGRLRSRMPGGPQSSGDGLSLHVPGQRVAREWAQTTHVGLPQLGVQRLP
jgi:hypothetical protein